MTAVLAFLIENPTALPLAVPAAIVVPSWLQLGFLDWSFFWLQADSSFPKTKLPKASARQNKYVNGQVHVDWVQF
jgi:hypothetical protein